MFLLFLTSLVSSIPTERIQTGTEKDAYLFDWSLPLFCPELYKELLLPIYFTQNDYLKTVDNQLYKSSWPSLFVAPKGTVSDLHIDAFGSHFWMALFTGRKKWTFFDGSVTNRLRPRFLDAFDPVFDTDLTAMTTEEYNKLSPFTVILEPGDVLFVPCGSPHRYVSSFST